MENCPYEIECGRCGAVKLELVTEQELRGIRDRIRPIYRICEQCGKMSSSSRG